MLLFRVGPVRSKTLPGGRVCACHTTEFLAPPNGILGKGTWENPPNFCLGKSCGVGETVWNLIRWMKHHMFFCWFHQSSSVYNIHKIPQVSMSLISKRVVCFIVFFLRKKRLGLPLRPIPCGPLPASRRHESRSTKLFHVGGFRHTPCRWRKTWIHCWTKCYLRCKGHFSTCRVHVRVDGRLMDVDGRFEWIGQLFKAFPYYT